MEDTGIVELYWARNETAIAETEKKYGAFCRRLAMNVLDNREDAEECAADALHRAWNAIPPERPRSLRAWLGRVTRNAALNLWDKNHARKRYGGFETLLSELSDCVPAAGTVDREIEDAELGRAISAWLYALPKDDRVLFVRRYWNGEALNALAKERNIAPGKLAQRMYRLRQSLKTALEKEDFYV